nr:rRNA pseudouridine synthase [Helicobacteraceae bacterium]
EGHNREVRRFFAHFDAEVVDLKRLSFGGIELNNLPTGKTRFLERSEYVHLREYLDNTRDEEKTKTVAEKARKVQIEEAAKEKENAAAKPKPNIGKKETAHAKAKPKGRKKETAKVTKDRRK